MRRPAVEYRISRYFFLANNTLQFDGELCHKFCLTQCLSFFRTMCLLSEKHFTTQHKAGNDVLLNIREPKAWNYSQFYAFFIIKIKKIHRDKREASPIVKAHPKLSACLLPLWMNSAFVNSSRIDFNILLWVMKLSTPLYYTNKSFCALDVWQEEISGSSSSMSLENFTLNLWSLKLVYIERGRTNERK